MIISGSQNRMKKERALRILHDHIEEIRKFHVVSIAIFGSVARDESSDASDIDILIEFDPNATVGLFMFIELKNYLSRILECDVDLATINSLRKEMRSSVLKEMIRAA